ncbi:MAG TPA: hypothetical protein VJT75_05940 [Thermoleophilaceae bacterium]|nr:hypothetical protein [Thermoleophilaceae bacterium]
MDDPASVLERWVEHGATFAVIELSRDRAVVELRTCYGEPVERLESSDPKLVRYLHRARP